MKTKKEFERWAWRIIRKYQKILLLQDHLIELEYDTKLSDGVLMQHGFNYPYKTTSLSYGSEALDMFKREKSKLTAVLIHELCHSITNPLYSVAADRFLTKDGLSKERERCTDHIANVIYFLVESN